MFKPKFDETLVENQDWKNFQLDEETKYVPVFIESPDIVSEEDRITMLVRCEEVFDPYGYGGNCEEFNAFCRSLMGVPEYPRDLFNYLSDEKYKDTCKYVREEYKKKCKEFIECFDINETQGIFESALVTSCFVRPRSFIHRDGRIGDFHNIGIKWTEMEDVSEEIEWFARLYPQYKVFLTLCRDRFNDKEPIPQITLMLYKGDVRVVTTRTVKQMRYVTKMSYGREDLLSLRTYKEPSKLYKLCCKIEDWLSDLKDNMIYTLFPKYFERNKTRRFYEASEHRYLRYFEDWEVRYIIDYFHHIIKTKN
jgi:hypothetical protein